MEGNYRLMEVERIIEAMGQEKAFLGCLIDGKGNVSVDALEAYHAGEKLDQFFFEPEMWKSLSGVKEFSAGKKGNPRMQSVQLTENLVVASDGYVLVTLKQPYTMNKDLVIHAPVWHEIVKQVKHGVVYIHHTKEYYFVTFHSITLVVRNTIDTYPDWRLLFKKDRESLPTRMFIEPKELFKALKQFKENVRFEYVSPALKISEGDLTVMLPYSSALQTFHGVTLNKRNLLKLKKLVDGELLVMVNEHRSIFGNLPPVEIKLRGNPGKFTVLIIPVE